MLQIHRLCIRSARLDRRHSSENHDIGGQFPLAQEDAATKFETESDHHADYQTAHTAKCANDRPFGLLGNLRRVSRIYNAEALRAR